MIISPCISICKTDPAGRSFAVTEVKYPPVAPRLLAGTAVRLADELLLSCCRTRGVEALLLRASGHHLLFSKIDRHHVDAGVVPPRRHRQDAQRRGQTRDLQQEQEQVIEAVDTLHLRAIAMP